MSQVASLAGGVLLAAATAYGVYVFLGDKLPRSKRDFIRLVATLRSSPAGDRVWSLLVRTRPDLGWAATPLGTDPVAIGRHASLAEGYDEAHAARVAHIALKIGRAVGLEEDVLASLAEAGHLHDAGVEDWDFDLTAGGPLSAEMRARLPEHVARSEQLAREIAPDPLVACWVRWHHERFDGSGYPDGLEAEEIPIPAQVLGLADTFEALSHRRPYREALDPQDALAELQRMAGIHFDPELISLFVREVYPELLGSCFPLKP